MEFTTVVNFVFLFITIKAKPSAGQSWRCTEDFCSELTLLSPCPNLSEDCKNSSKAVVLPSLSPCNCCDNCIIFQEEGKDCIVGSPGQPLPSTMCGPDLECSPITRKCVKMSGSGKSDPEFFPGYVCNPKTNRCNCATTDGENITEIFGEFEKTDGTENEKQCECSIVAHTAKNQPNKLFPFKDTYQPTPRCLTSGQFDPLQCLDTVCVCVDKETGLRDRAIPPIPLVLLQQDFPCFDPTIHKPGTYYTECETERNSLTEEKILAEIDGVRLLYGQTVDCNPDGTYVNSLSRQ